MAIVENKYKFSYANLGGHALDPDLITPLAYKQAG
jgi:hypothetical protein